MSNIEVRKRTWTTLEFSVPSPCVQGDVRVALHAATRAYVEATGHDPAAMPPDDAFKCEARDDSIVFIITTEQAV